MNGPVFAESFTMVCIGGWLMLQCLHTVVGEKICAYLLCVIGKLLLTAGFLLLHPYPVWALLLFFAFYPKYPLDGINLRLLGIQVLLPIVAAAFCVHTENAKRQIISVLSVALAVVLFAVVEFGIRSILSKNRLLYRQMEKTALNELKVKNLNREISVRSRVAERNARLEEREHIARNIHNVVGHTITSALVSLQAYEVLKEAEPVRAEGKLAVTSERMHLALEEIRRAVRVLDAETEEIGIRDFCSLLATEVEKFSMDTEIKILHNFSEGAEKEILIEKRTCEFLHSVLTECLNNGIRHGGATAFFAYLTFDTAHIRLEVSDDGKGFSGISSVEQKRRLEQGYGLRKMKEYTETHGGAFCIDTENGFKVQVELPLVKEEERTGGQ